MGCQGRRSAHSSQALQRRTYAAQKQFGEHRAGGERAGT